MLVGAMAEVRERERERQRERERDRERETTVPDVAVAVQVDLVEHGVQVVLVQLPLEHAIDVLLLDEAGGLRHHYQENTGASLKSAQAKTL